jgi:hypothetical protein
MGAFGTAGTHRLTLGLPARLSPIQQFSYDKISPIRVTGQHLKGEGDESASVYYECSNGRRRKRNRQPVQERRLSDLREF